MESQLRNDLRPNLSDAEAVYRNYLEPCRRLHIKSVSRGALEGSVGEWTATIGVAMASEYSTTTRH